MRLQKVVFSMLFAFLYILVFLTVGNLFGGLPLQALHMLGFLNLGGGGTWHHIFGGRVEWHVIENLAYVCAVIFVSISF